MTKEICDAMAMKRALTRMTYEIIEKNKELKESSLSASRQEAFILRNASLHA